MGCQVLKRPPEIPKPSARFSSTYTKKKRKKQKSPSPVPHPVMDESPDTQRGPSTPSLQALSEALAEPGLGKE